MACNKQNLSLLKLTLLAGGLAKANVNVLFSQYLQFEANFKIKYCSRGKTIMLANENIVWFIVIWICWFCAVTFGVLCTKYRPCSTSKA